MHRMRRHLANFVISLLLTFPAHAQEVGAVPNFLGPSDPSGTGAPDARRGIKFLITLDFPPFSFLDNNGRLNGFNVYLAKLVCAELSLEENCTIQSMPWQDVEPSLARGIGNAAISGFAATETSRSQYAFTKPYLRLPARFAGLKAAKGEIDFDAGLSGVKIGVLSQSAYAEMARSFFPEALITGFASDELLFSDLKSGKIDLAFGDGLRMAFWLSAAGGSCCDFEGKPYYSDRFLGEGMRIAVSADDVILQRLIDRALVSLQRKGKIEELYLRFFPVGFY